MAGRFTETPWWAMYPKTGFGFVKSYYDTDTGEIKTEDVTMAVNRFDSTPRDAFGRPVSSMEERILRAKQELSDRSEAGAREREAEYALNQVWRDKMRSAALEAARDTLEKTRRQREQDDYRKLVDEAISEPNEIIKTSEPKPAPKPAVDPTVARFSGLDWED